MDFLKPTKVSIILTAVFIIISLIISLNVFPCTYYAFNQNGIIESSATKSMCGNSIFHTSIGSVTVYSSLYWPIFILINLVIPFLLAQTIYFIFRKK